MRRSIIHFFAILMALHVFNSEFAAAVLCMQFRYDDETLPVLIETLCGSSI